MSSSKALWCGADAVIKLKLKLVRVMWQKESARLFDATGPSERHSWRRDRGPWIPEHSVLKSGEIKLLIIMVRGCCIVS